MVQSQPGSQFKLFVHHVDAYDAKGTLLLDDLGNYLAGKSHADDCHRIAQLHLGTEPRKDGTANRLAK